MCSAWRYREIASSVSRELSPRTRSYAIVCILFGLTGCLGNGPPTEQEVRQALESSFSEVQLASMGTWRNYAHYVNGDIWKPISPSVCGIKEFVQSDLAELTAIAEQEDKFFMEARYRNLMIVESLVPRTSGFNSRFCGKVVYKVSEEGKPFVRRTAKTENDMTVALISFYEPSYEIRGISKSENGAWTQVIVSWKPTPFGESDGDVLYSGTLKLDLQLRKYDTGWKVVGVPEKIYR